MPPATERAEKIDLRIGDRGVGAGELGFGVGENALGIEQLERVDRPFALLGAGNHGGAQRLVARALQGSAALEQAAVTGESRLRFLQRGQVRAVEAGEGRLRVGFRAVNAAAARSA